MKILLVMTTLLITLATATAQTNEKKNEAEIAVEKAMIELRQIPSDMKVLEESNKKLAISNQVQDDTTKMLNKQEQQIKNEEVPALLSRARKFDENIQNVLNRGCGANQTTDPNLARFCNSENEKARIERDALLAAQDSLGKRMQMIADARKAVTRTTLANFAQEKTNNAAISDLQSKTLELHSQVITRSMSIVRSNAIASQACKTLSPLEKASCCLSVVSDGRNPAQCDVELLFKLFENAGAFRTAEVKPAN